MFGYACNETENYMPVSLDLAQLIMKTRADIRKEGKEMTYLRPDSKSQVTIEYSDNGVPQRIDTIVVSTQHDDFVKDANGNEEWHLGKLIDKKELGKLVAKAHKLFGNLRTAEILDIVKKMGYDNACKSGISIATSDIKIPAAKQDILDATEKEVDKAERMFRRGLMSDEERHKKVCALWEEATNKVTDVLMKSTMDKFNSVAMMADSGARGNKQQIRQLAGMRGLMADPSGRIIDRPIKSNFREGLTILEYFISSHGARKGLADTALRTADSGYLTRRLVDVAQDVIVREDDCDVVGMNLVKERNRLSKNVLGSSQNKIRDHIMGRTCPLHPP